MIAGKNNGRKRPSENVRIINPTHNGQVSNLRAQRLRERV
jgi:hypothetical protein